MHDRRQEPRAAVELMINKYIDGYPYLCHALDISWTGLRLETVIEPAVRREFYPLEMGLPTADEPIWVWTRPVWTGDRLQALRFVGLDAKDARALAEYLSQVAA